MAKTKIDSRRVRRGIPHYQVHWLCSLMTITDTYLEQKEEDKEIEPWEFPTLERIDEMESTFPQLCRKFEEEVVAKKKRQKGKKGLKEERIEDQSLEDESVDVLRRLASLSVADGQPANSRDRALTVESLRKEPSHPVSWKRPCKKPSPVTMVTKFRPVCSDEGLLLTQTSSPGIGTDKDVEHSASSRVNYCSHCHGQRSLTPPHCVLSDSDSDEEIPPLMERMQLMAAQKPRPASGSSDFPITISD